MNKKINISIIIPAYNEEKIIERNIKKLYSYLKKNFNKFELLVVDDSSKDRTGDIIKLLSKDKKNLKYARFSNGPSRRENLGLALRKAKYPFVVYMDLDLAVDLNYLLPLVQELQKGYDIVIGSRRVEGSKVKRSRYRLILSILYHSVIHILFSSKIKDYQCGFKAFKKDVLFKLLDKIGYDKTFIRGWFWDAELLLTAEKENYRIKEMPIEWIEGKGSSFNILRELRVLSYIIRLKINS